MDPFSRTLGDYNSIMGNTGGDNRAEFDWRMPHAVRYELPIFNGFQFSALISPGQNYAKDNSDYAYGDYFQCSGSSARASGSNFPGTGGAVNGNIGGNGCTDGSYGNAYSAALNYKNGPFTALAAFELHEGVNRHGDDGLEPGQVAPIFLADGSQVLTGVHNEWAAKVGGGYRFNDGIGDLQLNTFYEWIRREVTPIEQPFNERSRDGVFASATQRIGKWALSASYAHAFRTPGNPAMVSVTTPCWHRWPPCRPICSTIRPANTRSALATISTTGQVGTLSPPNLPRAPARIIVWVPAAMATRSAVAMAPTTRSAVRQLELRNRHDVQLLSATVHPGRKRGLTTSPPFRF